MDRAGTRPAWCAVAGFDRPDSGRVLLDGEDLHAMPRARLESRVAWFGAVIPKPGRTRGPIPPLVVGDDSEAPFVVELESAPNIFAAWNERTLLDRRLEPLLVTIRYLCAQGAVVVIGTTNRVLIHNADQVVRL